MSAERRRWRMAAAILLPLTACDIGYALPSREEIVFDQTQVSDWPGVATVTGFGEKRDVPQLPLDLENSYRNLDFIEDDEVSSMPQKLQLRSEGESGLVCAQKKVPPRFQGVSAVSASEHPSIMFQTKEGGTVLANVCFNPNKKHPSNVAIWGREAATTDKQAA